MPRPHKAGGQQGAHRQPRAARARSRAGRHGGSQLRNPHTAPMLGALPPQIVAFNNMTCRRTRCAGGCDAGGSGPRTGNQPAEWITPRSLNACQ